MGKEVVPFRMAAAGVEWCDNTAIKHEITRSDVIRMALQFAKEAESDGRFTAYLRRAVAQGRITVTAKEEGE